MLSSQSNFSSNHLAIAQGIRHAEIHDLLRKHITAGYDSVHINYPLPDHITVTIVTGQPDILTENNFLLLNQIEMLVALRYSLPPNNVKAIIETLPKPDLSPSVQAELLASKIESGIQVRRAVYTVLRSAMRAGARGAQITVAGKVRGARAKKLIFRTGWITKSGSPAINFVRSDVRHINLKQGVLGFKVTFMMPGPRDGTDFPDSVELNEDRDMKKKDLNKE